MLRGDRCPRCRGNLFIDKRIKEIECLQCGYTRSMLTPISPGTFRVVRGSGEQIPLDPSRNDGIQRPLREGEGDELDALAADDGEKNPSYSPFAKGRNRGEGLPGIPGDRPDTSELRTVAITRELEPWLRRHRGLIELYIDKEGSVAAREAWGVGERLWYRLLREWGLMKPRRGKR